MGFYFRKSFKFGGMRVNFSKSGVGFSGGVKGFRIGKGPRGNYIHMGANGIYYKKTLNGRNNRPSSQPSISPEPGQNYNFQDIESSDVANLVDASSEELLKEINEKNRKVRFSVLWTIISVVLMLFNPALILLLLLLPVFIYVDKRRKNVVLVYDIESENEEKLQKFYESFNELINARKKWHIPSVAALNTTYDKKTNAGAANLVKRSEIRIDFSAPPYFVTNVKVPRIPVGKQTLYFFPDKVLVFEKKRVGCVNYKDLRVRYSNVRFIEESKVPSDTRVVGRTWKYVNKNGGPDKRYSDNPELPIVEYSRINFFSDTGLNEIIQLSKPDIGEKLAQALETVQ